jgi:hypothetical protein
MIGVTPSLLRPAGYGPVGNGVDFDGGDGGGDGGE